MALQLAGTSLIFGFFTGAVSVPKLVILIHNFYDRKLMEIRSKWEFFDSLLRSVSCSLLHKRPVNVGEIM